MKNLGKKIGLIVFLAHTLFATVTARVEPRELYIGDSANYILTLSGNDIKKPVILDICGSNITATGSSTNIQMINGNYTKTYELSYSFVVEKNCTIDNVDVSIDSQMEHANSVDVVVQPRGVELNADFILSLKSSKKELYVGEPFDMTLILKQKRGAEAVDSKFIAPNFTGFWKKSESPAKKSEQGAYIITTVKYTLAPQREGTLSIAPAQLKIASRLSTNNWGSFMPQVRWRTYLSDRLKLKVKALPNNTKLIGNFLISVEAEKRSVNANEALNIVVRVQGIGNLEDIESFKPYIEDVNVFDEKIEVKGNVLTQKLVFVAEKGFTIPAFTLHYFDTKTQKLTSVQTEPIKIQVHKGAPTQKLQVVRQETPLVQKVTPIEPQLQAKQNYLYIFMAFVIGILLGVIAMLLKKVNFSKKSSKIDIKDEKMLLIKLLPFKEADTEVLKIVTILEENIYSSSKEKIDKKLLKEILKKYDIN